LLSKRQKILRGSFFAAPCTTKQNAAVSIQLHIVARVTYQEKFTRGNIHFTVLTSFRCHCHSPAV